MDTNIILSVIGPDKFGIVSDISGIIKKHSGNIDKSRMTKLGNFFTIMMLININSSNIKKLNSDLQNYSNYQISIHELKKEKNDNPGNIYTINLNGLDNEGLVYEITNQLALLNINIEELKTNLENAPMSGVGLFSLTAKISYAESNNNLLKEKMNILANELDVNITIED